MQYFISFNTLIQFSTFFQYFLKLSYYVYMHTYIHTNITPYQTEPAMTEHLSWSCYYIHGINPARPRSWRWQSRRRCRFVIPIFLRCWCSVGQFGAWLCVSGLGVAVLCPFPFPCRLPHNPMQPRPLGCQWQLQSKLINLHHALCAWHNRAV